MIEDEEKDTAEIADALTRAGIADSALPIALAEFRPVRTGDWWSLDGKAFTTLRKHAQQYAESHPFLLGAKEAPPSGGPTNSGYAGSL